MIRFCQTAVMVILLLLPAAAGAMIRHVCPGYQVDAPVPIRFNANEKKLICGDERAASWEKIPVFQAEYFIRTFLQQRGYFFPEIRGADGIVTILPGPQAHVERIDVAGSPPPTLHVDHRRGVRGAVLTPAVLTSLEEWTRGELKASGYPCPAVTSTADAATGVVTLTVEPGERQSIIQVTEDSVPGLRPGTLRRFDAFRIGDPFDAHDLTVTTNRIEADGILQTGYFLTECTPEGTKLHQKAVPGPTRLFSIGFGASTEDYFIVKMTWKMARLGQNASSFLLSGWGSYRQQRFTAEAMIYPFSHPSRWFFGPSLTSRRVNESRYVYFANDIFLPPAVTWERGDAHFRLAFGPKLNLTRTSSGALPGTTHFVSGSLRFDVVSHEYEYYLSDPRSGYMLTASADFNHDRVFSSVTAQQLQIKGEALWDFGWLEPPLFVFAVRGFAGTTLANDTSSSFPRLPPEFLYYLGGSENMRGFGRVVLPNTNRGALTSLYAGAELRLTNILPLNLQPFVFVDVGVLGQKSLDLDFPAYWSPGLGMRWPSPIGVLRVTGARGYLAHNSNPANWPISHWQFYFSLGEEF